LQSLVIRKLERWDAEAVSRIQIAIIKGPATIDYHRVVQEEAGKRTGLVL
jgi:hypothetical protein